MGHQSIEKYYHNGIGYNPFFIKDTWQVAQLNYTIEQGLSALEKMDRHLHTDEVFVLTKGTAILIATNMVDEIFHYELIKMEVGVTYNIPLGLWHNIAMDIDAQVIIIEKSNTHLLDFEFQYLTEEEKTTLNRLIKESFERI